MEYSHFAAPHIMPLIHPSEDDLAMGAVDYLAENPLGNMTTPSSDNVPTLNITLVGKINDIVRSVLPRVVTQVASGVASKVANTAVSPPVEHISSDVTHEDVAQVPIDVQVDLVPTLYPQEFN
jgi:hypothetical protein